MKRGRLWLAVAVLLLCAGCKAPGDKADEPAPWPEEALAPYAAVLSRDLSQVEPAEDYPWMGAFHPDFDWEYTLIDVSGDGEPELFVRMTDQHAQARMFHAEDGVVQWWYYQDVEMNYVWEPLSDGGILVTYDYGGGISHDIYVLDQDGTRPELPVESLYHRYEVYVPEQTISWSHNKEATDEASYERLLQKVVEDKRIQNWTPLP